MDPHMHMDMQNEEIVTADPITVPLSREGGGTAWIPDSSPMYGLMGRSGPWELMYHGAFHLVYDQMNGKQGDTEVTSLNWVMIMARRDTGGGNQLRLSAMFSFEPLTVGGDGYPLLFQTGETWNDKPLRDHQHPHNFFTEISGMYTYNINSKSGMFLYAAPVGQPALGPPVYMHRISGLDNPAAPLGHHWQDATHISFGVATLGYQTGLFQMELSSFNGREPGENRYEIAKPRFDSISGRFSVNPSRDMAFQISYGFLKSPEALHQEEDIHRLISSLIYNHTLGMNRDFYGALIWGKNRIEKTDLDSFMAEMELKHDNLWTPFLRYEFARKTAGELSIENILPGRVFDINQLALGMVRDFFKKGPFQAGIGGQVFLNFPFGELEEIYGKKPAGFMIFVRVHPARMEH